MCCLLMACAGPERTTTAPSDSGIKLTASEIIQRINLPSTPSSMSATADLSFQSPLYKGSATAKLQHRLGDSILVSLSVKGLGIQIARLLVTSDSFFLYNRIDREITTGANNRELLPELFHTRDAMSRLLGLIKPEESIDWEVLETPSGAILNDPDRNTQWIIDPEVWRVISFERYLPSGDLAEALHFADFDTFGDTLYPKRVTYRNPLTNTVGILHFRSLLTNLDITNLSLNPPAGTKRTPYQ